MVKFLAFLLFISVSALGFASDPLVGTYVAAPGGGRGGCQVDGDAASGYTVTAQDGVTWPAAIATQKQENQLFGPGEKIPFLTLLVWKNGVIAYATDTDERTSKVGIRKPGYYLWAFVFFPITKVAEN